MSGAADDLADSTDWLNTPLSGLAPLESGLRCQVCKDFFTTPMITSCSHTFCSLCIRRYLSQEGRCPACRESDQEMKLRRNWAVEELVAHFTQARSSMLAFARQPPPRLEPQESDRPKKRRKVEVSESAPTRRSTRSQSKRVANDASQTSVQEPQSTQEEIADSDREGSVYEPQARDHTTANNQEPNDGLVACPCCHRRMKEASINAHLDRCIQGLPTSPSPPVLQPITNGNIPATTLPYAQRTKSPLVTKQQDRLPTINYSMYTETSLRKKLKELGIPSHGNKELMRRRHTEWMNLWNANCDSLHPRSKSNLLKELDTWERTLGRQLERGVTSATSGVMVKDFDRDSWAKSQKGEFDDLIKRARAQKKAASGSEDQEKAEKPAGDVLMTGNDDTPNGSSLPDSLRRLVEDHATSLGPQPLPQGSDSPIAMPTNGTRDEVEQHAKATTEPHIDSTPGTPQKLVVKSEQIDLTSSPVPVLNDQSPGKQRSRFFA